MRDILPQYRELKNSLLYLPSIKYWIIFISACNSSKNRLFIILLFGSRLLYFRYCFMCYFYCVFFFPNAEGLNINGIYQFSRNPMYVAYFICFIGMSLLTQSLILLGIVIIFQVSAHWIILSEERWCIKRFGKSYEEYMKKVRRYI